MSKVVNDTNTKKKSKGIDKRSLSLRLFSVGSVIAIIAILIVVNILFETVLGNVLKWDLTQNQSNSIGDISKGILTQIDKDVEIVGLFELNDANELQYKDFIPLLKDYEAQSGGRVRVRYVDPQKYPSIIKELDPNGTLIPDAGAFIVKSGDRLRQVTPEDCYVIDEQTYYSTGVINVLSNSVEMNFTGAIQSVTSDSLFKVLFTTNHGEQSAVQITSLLRNNGFSVEEVSTMSIDKIPDDCSMVIVHLPTSDLSKDDIKMFTDFLEAGGNLIVVTDFSAQGVTFTNLNEVLHTMNLNITDSLISENNMDYRFQATTGYGSYANVKQGSISDADVDQAILSAYNRGINVFDNPKAYISTEALITSSSNAVLEENGDPTKAGIEGTQNIAMYSQNAFGAVPGEAVVIGTSYLTSDSFIENFSLNHQNISFFYTIVKKLVGMESTVQIPVKEYPSFTLSSMPSANTQTAISIFLIAIVPLALIVTSIIVYRKRKHL